jgi:two-component system chemotaxis response regulator CheB
MNQIKVMVVNDSLYMRELLIDLLNSNPKIKVSETARDGVDALAKLRQNRPDVILLDLEMPNMDGFTFIEKAMQEKPVPIVVISSYAQDDAEIVFEALESGAVDFVPIPQEGPEKLSQLKNNLVSKILVAAQANLELLQTKTKKNDRETDVKGAASKVVVIGASTGGPGVLGYILSELPNNLSSGILIVQHMPLGFTAGFAKHLDSVSKIRVKEADNGDVIKEGIALVAPADYHMLVKPSKCVELDQSPKVLGVRPSVNMSMITASDVYGANTVGILLSGMGRDGAFGMKVIKKRGGITVAQDESSSVVYGMAKSANDLCAVDKTLPIEKIPQEIVMAVDGHVR